MQNKALTLTKPTPEGPQQAMFKLITVGDSGTGKSCLITRYTKDHYDNDYRVTIGVEFAVKRIQIDENYRVKMQIWDTAGQESFRSIVKSFYRNAAAVVLVYDVTNEKSFKSLREWIKEARESSPENAIFVLMGTHIDLVNQRQVSKQQAQKFVKQQQIALFFETSAKTSQNVNKAFDQIGKQLFLKIILKNKQQKQKQKQNLQRFGLSLQQPKMFTCC